MNYRKGFQRLYTVLAIGWIGLCLYGLHPPMGYVPDPNVADDTEQNNGWDGPDSTLTHDVTFKAHRIAPSAVSQFELSETRKFYKMWRAEHYPVLSMAAWRNVVVISFLHLCRSTSSYSM
jgi:hypothetical protein